MQQSRHRRHLLAVVAVTAIVGLGATALPNGATATMLHPRALGAAVPSTTAPSSLPAGPAPATCVSGGANVACGLYAKAGTVTAGAVSGIPIWGFTTDSTGAGLLGGDPLNTIIINDTNTLTLNVHNCLPAGAGDLFVEIPAAAGPPPVVAAADDPTCALAPTAQTFGPLAAGTYVYQAGSTVEQPRQLAMGLAAIVIVRPTNLAVLDTTHAYAGSLGAFNAEALVVMNEIDPAFNNAPLTSDVEDYTPHYFFINGKAHPLTEDIAAQAGNTVLLRAANLGIRDRALGLVNSRLTLIGDDSHQIAESNKVDLESKLLTPGQVADVTTLIDPTAPVGAQFALLDLDRHLNNSGEGGIGGMLTFIDVVAPPILVGNPLIDRAYATDFPPEQIGGLDAVLVVLDDALPAGTLQSFETWNQATAGGSPNPSATEQFRAYVLRPTGTLNEYDVVYESAVQTVPAPAVAGVSEIFSVPAGVAVQAGDHIAYFGSGVPVDITPAGTDSLIYPTLAAPANGDTITLGSPTYPFYPQARTYSFRATVAAAPAAGAPAAKVTSLTPPTNDNTITVSVDYTITGSAGSASWFLDSLGGPCTGSVPAGAGPHTVTLTPAVLSLGACGPTWITGDHVLWIQPAAGSASGGVFTLAKEGPSVFALSTDPQFANLTLNKVDTDPTSTDIVLTGSAQPSLLDFDIDAAEACLTDPALNAGTCPAPIAVDTADPVVPSHTSALSVHIPVASFPLPSAVHTIYVRALEIPTTTGAPRWSAWGSPNSTVDVTIDRAGPTVGNFTATPNPAGIGNYPGNLNFLESVRVQVDITDQLLVNGGSPIADAELFLDQVEADGTGSQMRPLAGQWLDDLTVNTRTAYLEIPVSELQARPQGTVAVFIHAKDAAGNWGAIDPSTPFILQLDKTNPLIVGTVVDAGNHGFLPDETGLALASGDITINATCDPNGVTAVGICPAGGTTAVNPVTSGIGEIRYHVSAVTGQIGTAGAGIFYQTAQIAPINAATVIDNLNGTVSITFNWHIIPQPPLPIEAASSVWVWVVDGAGNPSVPVEVPVGPPTP